MNLLRLAAVLTVLAVGCSEGGAAVPETTLPVPAPSAPPSSTTTIAAAAVVVGAEALADDDFALLAGRRVGLIANQTSTAHGEHLIDLLHDAPDVDLRAVFAPEHGVRGTADAGELLDDTTDPATGVTVFSLYGDTRQPTPEMLADLDVLVYDLQDVGARFYTYISTMGLAMQAAAAVGVEFVVLDRPDPSGGGAASGFVLEPDQTSFIGQYPIPAAYGLTAGELAELIQAQGWMAGLDQLELDVVPMQGWVRSMTWAGTGRPWVPPSPGLRTVDSAIVYPGTVLFEATSISFGGGTPEPFTKLGAPWVNGPALARELNARDLPGVAFEAVRFTPRPISGITRSPRLVGERLQGVRVVVTDTATFDAFAAGVHALDAFLRQGDEAGVTDVIDRPETFDLLAGTTRLRELLTIRALAADIVAASAASAESFEPVRTSVLRYEESR